ncbi:MAG TPA: hypothetical protein VJ728_01940 [Candidatus Binataceae bacterium]|nr:hypothetical protein [Candidatus Binataceae bacterium]
MDGLTYLALAAKAKLVFEDVDTFLSFPATTPLNYTANNLSFGAFNSTDSGERLVYSEFARVVNALPAGTIYEMGDKFLWDVYANVLRGAILAHSQATAQDAAAYERAVAFLNVVDGSGASTASPQLLAYRQFRDAWFVAVQNYKTQQSTAESLTDSAAIAQWKNVDEPRLRAQVEQARSDWEAKGFKQQVEEAEQTQQEYAARSPELMWKSWSALFDPDIDLMTDPIGQQFAPTSFVPSDIFAHDWLTFSIKGPEITRLIAAAPDELKTIFATEGSQATVDALSFEYRAVSIARHWFKPEVFNARFWRLPDGCSPLSDGGDPPKGEWPAYIVAVVFMRNINVTMHADHPAPPRMIRALPTFRYVAVAGAGPRPQMRLTPVAPIMHVAPPPHPMIPAAIRVPPPIAAERFAVVAPIRPMTPIHTAVPIRIGLPVRPIIVQPPHTTGVAGQPGSPQAPPAKPEPAPDPKNDISILAFICKRLPKTPDPDPGLDWNSKSTGP